MSLCPGTRAGANVPEQTLLSRDVPGQNVLKFFKNMTRFPVIGHHFWPPTYHRQANNCGHFSYYPPWLNLDFLLKAYLPLLVRIVFDRPSSQKVTSPVHSIGYMARSANFFLGHIFCLKNILGSSLFLEMFSFFVRNILQNYFSEMFYHFLKIFWAALRATQNISEICWKPENYSVALVSE